MNDIPALIPLDEVAATLGVSPRWLRLQCREKRVPHVRIARTYRFTSQNVTEILGMLSVSALAPEKPVPKPTPQRRKRVDGRKYATYGKRENDK